MAFERFVKTGRSFKPLVTLRRSGNIGLNNGAINRFALDRYPFVALYYDRDTRRIGIELLKTPDEPGAMKLRIKEGNASISSRAFLEKFGIPYTRGERYDAVWDDDEQKIIADLRKPVG